MLRLAFDFIITWRETRTRPNAYVLNIKFNLHSYLFLCLLARFLRNSAFILAAPDPCNPVI